MGIKDQIKSVIVLVLSFIIIMYGAFLGVYRTSEPMFFVSTLIPGMEMKLTTDASEAADDSEVEEIYRKNAELFAKMTEASGDETSAEDFTYEVIDNSLISINHYNGVAEKVIIPATIDNMAVSVIGGDCFANNMYLTEVVIPDSILTIENGAFRECSKLTSVELPAYLITIGDSSFKGDTSLTTVTKRGDSEGTVHAVREIYSGAFEECSALAEVSLGGSDFSYAIIWDGAFSNCPALETVTLPENTSELYNGVFYNCPMLSQVKGIENVKTIANSCFEGCTSMTEIRLSGDIEWIGGSAFANCTVLTSVKFGERTVATNENGELITTSLDDCCFKGTAISEIDIPGYVRYIGGNSFADCPNLTIFMWENSGQNQPTQEYGDCVFENCPSLTDVYMPITVSNSSRFTGDEAQHFALHTSSQSVMQYCDEIGLVYDEWN